MKGDTVVVTTRNCWKHALILATVMYLIKTDSGETTLYKMTPRPALPIDDDYIYKEIADCM